MRQRPRLTRNLSFNSLADYQWITYPVHMPMRALLERELDLAGIPMPPSPISTASTFVTVALLQQSAKLVSMLPSEVADMFTRRGMLTILPIDLKSKSQTVGVVTRANGNLSKAAQAFLALLRAHARAVAT
jgi:DNA-binding transcriptional LysR family regulator